MLLSEKMSPGNAGCALCRSHRFDLPAACPGVFFMQPNCDDVIDL